MFDRPAPMTKATMVAEVEAARPGLVLDRSNSRMIARNTLEFTLPDGAKVTRYHHTDVVIADKSGFKLDTGGWHTPTTKERICAALPSGWGVYANSGLWHIRTPAGHYTFADGMKLRPDGTPTAPAMLQKEEARVKREKALVKAFLKHAESGWGDTAGDPWYVITGGPDREETLNVLRSKYYTRALLVEAFKTRLNDAGLSLHLYGLERTGGKLTDSWHKRILRRYLYQRLGIAC